MLGVGKSDEIGKFVVALWSHHHYKQSRLRPLLGILVSFTLLKSVTSHAKTFLTVCRFETVAVRKPFISRSNGMGCRSNGLSYPFKNN